MANPRPNAIRAWRWPLAGLAAVVAFGWLAGRFWHPHYGFTAFLQLDSADAAVAVPGIQARPVHVYPGHNGYDGFAYAEIAFHPLLDSPALQPAVGNVPYRARRILGSWLAWLIAGGAPERIAHAYAALNLGVWLVLAWLAWRLIAVADLRGWCAWAGFMFSAGALHSVRLALTDLPGVTLLAAAMWLAEKKRDRAGLGALAIAGLARETVLPAVVAWWRGPWGVARPWAINVLRAAAVAIPLALWLGYVRWKAGPADQGLGNFAWPMAGWLEKWPATLSAYAAAPGFAWLVTTTLLATIGLTAQAAFFLRHRDPADAWWRLGAVFVALMAMLGTAVWEGHPGAATRVLLPLGLAFAVFAARKRAAWPWLVAGHLSVFAGVLALSSPPRAADEFAAGRSGGGSFVARLGDGWFNPESRGAQRWAWSAQRATLDLDLWRREPGAAELALELRALTPRIIEVRRDGAVLWRGEIGTARQRVTFPTEARARGPVTLEISSAAAPQLESAAPGARALGFAV
ncbi:MAG: hypothetical protein JNL39_13305, partial [Opitutaceae bacterium]|nr:hypothetical protein [Opitutaceae bacterium]